MTAKPASLRMRASAHQTCEGAPVFILLFMIRAPVIC
jgi:hypothetical protein